MSKIKFNPLSYGYNETQWRELDARSRFLICRKAYRLRNSEKILKDKAAHRAANKEKIKAADALFRAKNREKRRAQDREYEKKRPPRTEAQKVRKRETDRIGYYADLERSRKRSRDYYAANAAKLAPRYHERWLRIKSTTKAFLDPEAIWMRIDKAVNRSLPAHIREDVVSAMVLAALEGKLHVDKIESAARSFVTEYNRNNRVYEDVSLDAPIPGMEGITYLDKLVDDTIASDANLS